MRPAFIRKSTPSDRKATRSRGRLGLPVIAALTAVIAPLYLAALSYPQAVDHLRYRLTIEAVVDGRPVSASSVIGVDRIWKRRFDLAWDTETQVDGEAVFLDVGRSADGKPLNVIVSLISRDPYGRGMADRWPYWGEITTGGWFGGLEPAHYRWVEAAGHDYPSRVNTTNAAVVQGKISLERTVEPVLFSISDPVRGYGLGDVTRSFLKSRGLTITSISAEPAGDTPITRSLAQRIPWIDTEPAERWRTTIGDLRDRSIFVQESQKTKPAK